MTDTQTSTPPEQTQPAETKQVILSSEAKFAAMALVVLYIILALYMVVCAKQLDGEIWPRVMAVFTSVEAIVFTAAGALFGAQIQRTITNKVQETADRNAEDADAAKKKAEDAQHEATHAVAGFNALKAVIDSQADDTSGAALPESATSEQTSSLLTHHSNTLTGLKELADKLSKDLKIGK